MNRKYQKLQWIVRALKDELEHYSSEEDYIQWIMALAMKKKISKDDLNNNQESYIVRTVLKTSESPFVDGTDLKVVIDLKRKEAILDEDSLEDAPMFHGGGIDDSLRWLEKVGEIEYQQMKNPFTKVTTSKGGEKHVE